MYMICKRKYGMLRFYNIGTIKYNRHYLFSLETQAQEQRTTLEHNAELAADFERRFHISADDEHRGDGSSNNTSQVSCYTT